MPSNKDKQSNKQPSLLCYLYPGPFGGHNAYALQDENGNTAFQSYHSITQEYLQKQKEDPDYIPPTERQFKEDDLPYVIDQFKRTQLSPMYHSQAMIITVPKMLSDTLPPPVEIPLSPQEYKKAKVSMNKTQDAVNKRLQGYSIWARQSGDIQLESCASVTQNLLDEITRPNEKQAIAPSKLEQYTTSLPTRVHGRAKTLASARTASRSSNRHTSTFFNLPTIEATSPPVLDSQRLFNPFI